MNAFNIPTPMEALRIFLGGIVRSFSIALVWSVVFFGGVLFFLRNPGVFPGYDIAVFGGDPLWVILLLYGGWVLIAGILSFFMKGYRGVPVFLLLFWACGALVMTPSSVPESVRSVEQDAVAASAGKKLPAPEGEKTAAFNWEYKGVKYAITVPLYLSFYQYYKTLPTGIPSDGGSASDHEAMRNEMLISGAVGDDAVHSLAQQLYTLGEKHRLTSDQLVEFVSVFVQTIPYDQGKLDRRTEGLSGMTEKPSYPYEVLYENTGVCQDKSYLEYALLRELGYGVAIFLFPNPEDNHMAVGVQCPLAYSNYESGYCFVETTSLGNRIGMIPELIPKSRIAVSNVAVSVTEDGQAVGEASYQSLGNVEILNQTDGKEYRGIIATIGTQKELERLRKTIENRNRELAVLGADIDSQKKALDAMEKKLKNLKDDERYDDYNDLVKKFNKALTAAQKDIKSYNDQVAANNAAVTRYRDLAEDFYR